jgi:hypothetical protein
MALEKASRSIVAQMKANPNLTGEMLQNAGLSRRAGKRSRVSVPGAPPNLHIVGQRGTEFTLQIFDSESTRRGKPRDVSTVSVYGFVGEQPPASIKEFIPLKQTSRANRVTVRFDPQLPPGTTVWLTANWRSARGEGGPGCAPVCAYLGRSGPVGLGNIRCAA